MNVASAAARLTGPAQSSNGTRCKNGTGGVGAAANVPGVNPIAMLMFSSGASPVASAVNSVPPPMISQGFASPNAPR